MAKASRSPATAAAHAACSSRARLRADGVTARLAFDYSHMCDGLDRRNSPLRPSLSQRVRSRSRRVLGASSGLGVLDGLFRQAGVANTEHSLTAHVSCSEGGDEFRGALEWK